MGTATTRYNLLRPTVGGDSDAWGGYLNVNVIEYLDALLGAPTTTGSGAAYVLSSGASLTAYTQGLSLQFKASFTCNAAATINVDGLGAKNLTKNGTTATVSGDIISGNVYRAVYDGTQFQVSGAVGASGLLVASNNLSDLGSATTARTNLGLGTAAVVNTGTSGGTAALNNGANTWSALQKFTAGIYNATATARFEGTDSAPAGATGVGLELFQDGTNVVVQAFNRSSPAFSPIDFKASSFTFSNGIQAPVLVSSETSGSLTSASRNKQVHCSGGVTLPSSGITDGDFIVIDPRGTARTITRPGGHTMYVANADVATATTGAHNICVAKYHGSSKWSIGGSVS